ncbi:hypothetical protein OG943_45795 [Amycolatopsis sp. NBC_00345]|uniref:hypothetical protein n=1 Tax=Amycolatopsis sp. NBC_00345 TaxID=2975955 RepID=UPI002E25C476
MTGYETDPARLRQAADRLAEQHGEFENGGGPLRFSMRPEGAGEALLARSLARFHEASSRATELVGTDLARLAERLKTAADHYSGYESEAAEAIREAGAAPTGTPDATEDTSDIRRVLG